MRAMAVNEGCICIQSSFMRTDSRHLMSDTGRATKLVLGMDSVHSLDAGCSCRRRGRAATTTTSTKAVWRVSVCLFVGLVLKSVDVWLAWPPSRPHHQPSRMHLKVHHRPSSWLAMNAAPGWGVVSAVTQLPALSWKGRTRKTV